MYISGMIALLFWDGNENPGGWVELSRLIVEFHICA